MTSETLKTVHTLPNFLQVTYRLEARRKVGDAKLPTAKQGNPLLFRYPQRHLSNATSAWCSFEQLGGKIESGGPSSKSDVLEDGESHVV